MLTVATCLWKANEHSQLFSQCYDESWVEKLYRAFRRNLNWPFRFICWVDQPRKFSEPLEYKLLQSPRPFKYGCMIEPFADSASSPMIIVGLDTIITRNIDHLAFYCHSERRIALPRDPYKPERSINGIALVPQGNQNIYRNWLGENDMEWLRTFQTNYIDDIWPGDVISYKAHKVSENGYKNASVVYFHGNPKPHHLPKSPLVKEHWI